MGVLVGVGRSCVIVKFLVVGYVLLRLFVGREAFVFGVAVALDLRLAFCPGGVYAWCSSYCDCVYFPVAPGVVVLRVWLGYGWVGARVANGSSVSYPWVRSWLEFLLCLCVGSWW